MSIKSTVTNDGKTLHVAMSGRFDFNCVQDFRKAYADRDKYESYEVDLRDVDHIDSSALGMLLNMRKYCGESVEIRVTNSKPAIKKILLISRFDKKFRID